MSRSGGTIRYLKPEFISEIAEEAASRIAMSEQLSGWRVVQQISMKPLVGKVAIPEVR